MSGEQLIVLALLAAAFVAGWVARGASVHDEESDAAPDAPDAPDAAATPAPLPVASPASVPAATPPPGAAAPPPVPSAQNGAGVLAGTRDALARAIDAWLDDRGSPSRSGEEAVAELARHAASLREQGLGPQAATAERAREVLDAYLAGRPMDAAASRQLDDAEQALA